jgi:hypothetical protein
MTETLRVTFCDICHADDVRELAEGTYTTDEGKTFDACMTHLEECNGHGFTTHLFDNGTGNIPQR